MNKEELLKSEETVHSARLQEYEANKNLINLIPSNVDCVRFVGNLNAYFLEHTTSVANHQAQLAQWATLNPEMDYYAIHEDALSCTYTLSNNLKLHTYCSDVENLLNHVSEGTCTLKREQVERLSISCPYQD